MLLTTKDNIKSALNMTENTDDVFLTSLAYSVSAAIEKYLMRELEIKSRTEHFDVDNGQEIFFVKAFPISSILIYNDANREFTSALSAVDYSVLGDQGRIVVDQYELTSGRDALKVVYTGGLALNQAALQLNFPDLEMAARLQAVLWFKSKDRINVSSELTQGGGSVQYKKLGLDESVKLILDGYRNTSYV
jgi:hypothetical protein